MLSTTGGSTVVDDSVAVNSVDKSAAGNKNDKSDLLLLCRSDERREKETAMHGAVLETNRRGAGKIAAAVSKGDETAVFGENSTAGGGVFCNAISAPQHRESGEGAEIYFAAIGSRLAQADAGSGAPGVTNVVATFDP